MVVHGNGAPNRMGVASMDASIHREQLHALPCAGRQQGRVLAAGFYEFDSVCGLRMSCLRALYHSNIPIAIPLLQIIPIPTQDHASGMWR